MVEKNLIADKKAQSKASQSPAIFRTPPHSIEAERS